MYRDYGLESSAFAIKLLNKFGELGNILDEQIDEAVSFFMDCLDPEDGFFKAYGSYLTIGRPIPYAEKAVDFVLDLQRKDGAFGENDDPQPMTINWDSLWDIKVLNNQLEGSYRMKDIQDAGNRMAEFLLKVHHKSDGGFSFYPDHCLPVHNSVRISDKKPESDSLGILMGVQCMEYADEWNAMPTK
jgi:hypothetical protein